MIQLNKIVVIIAVLVLTGCQEHKEDLSAFIASVKAKQKPKIEPMPVMKTYDKFVYSASELRDPFIVTVVDVAPPVEEEIKKVVDNGIHPDTNRLKEALESYELGELQFVGTLQQENLWALVRSPEGVIHRVKVGDYMGKHDGKITAITETEIKLKEIVPDGDVGYIERDNSLKIAEIHQ